MVIRKRQPPKPFPLPSSSWLWCLRKQEESKLRQWPSPKTVMLDTTWFLLQNNSLSRQCKAFAIHFAGGDNYGMKPSLDTALLNSSQLFSVRHTNDRLFRHRSIVMTFRKKLKFRDQEFKSPTQHQATWEISDKKKKNLSKTVNSKEILSVIVIFIFISIYFNWSRIILLSVFSLHPVSQSPSLKHLWESPTLSSW